MAVPMVLKNTNVRGATHEAPLTGERAAAREREDQYKDWWIEGDSEKQACVHARIIAM